MNETPAPEAEVVVRAPLTPEPRPEVYPLLSQDRISRNPFFNKAPNPSHTPFSAPRPPSSAPKSPQGSPRVMPSPQFFIGIALVVVVLVAGYFVANQFASASVEIIPLTETATLDNEFTAQKEKGGSVLAFQFMSLSEEKTKEVPATTEQKIQKKATGKVVIYNAYSGDSQRLIKNTRLETPDHKIFRIDESVVVPGAKVSGGKVLTAGSVEAVVFADAPGKEYNIGLSDFTIPGFKGDPRYTKFTARSKGDSPLSGGFSGTVKVPSEEDVVSAQKELKEGLKSLAIEKARAQVPEGVTFFPGSMILKFEEVPQEFSENEKAKVVVRATVSVFFFDTELLAKAITEVVLPKYADTSLELSNKDDLAFTFVDPVDNVVLSDLTHIKFRITGDGNFVGKIDTEKLSQELAGKSKGSFTEAVSAQSNIKKANSTIFPVWKKVFPADPAKISIKIIKE